MTAKSSAMSLLCRLSLCLLGTILLQAGEVSAFSPVQAPSPSTSTSITSNTRVKSSPSDGDRVPYQYEESEMPLCALGINFALQVPGYLPSLLSSEELDILGEGFSTTLKGTGTCTSQQVLQTFGSKVNEILQERRQAQMAENQAVGAAFVDKFVKENPTAVTTDSGLVYLETKAGEGIVPKPGASVTVYYQATNTLSGKIVDSNLSQEQPLTVTMANVVPGWAEGLQFMKEGGKATLVLPSDLAYGAEGSGEIVLPGTTLQFDVELIQVQNQEDKVDVEIRSDDPQQVLTDENSDVVELPDGTRLRVPKGVKIRTVDPDEEGGGNTD